MRAFTRSRNRVCKLKTGLFRIVPLDVIDLGSVLWQPRTWPLATAIAQGVALPYRSIGTRVKPAALPRRQDRALRFGFRPRHLSLAAAGFLAIFLQTGCAIAMHHDDHRQHLVDGNLLPLRFKSHNFEAKVYNTVRCKIVYNGHEFAPQAADAPTGPPPSADYRDRWGFAFFVGIRNFPKPAHVSWTSKDGTTHEADVDISDIFKNEQVLYKVPDEEFVPDMYPQGLFLDPSIYLEVNDRTISVYMKALVPTRHLQVPGNQYSDARDDVMLAWTHTY